MKPKLLTDKQIIYIFNVVILPWLLYRIQLTFLNHKFCDQIMGSFRQLLRSKLRLSKDTPLAVFHSPISYNLLHLFDEQIKDKTIALHNFSNDKGLLGSTSNIRLNQLQITEWLPTSPLHRWPHKDPAPFKDWI